jgi:hypothetical protein
VVNRTERERRRRRRRDRREALLRLFVGVGAAWLGWRVGHRDVAELAAIIERERTTLNRANAELADATDALEQAEAVVRIWWRSSRACDENRLRCRR